MYTDFVPSSISQDFFYKSFDDHVAIEKTFSLLNSKQHYEQAVHQLKHNCSNHEYLNVALKHGIVDHVHEILSTTKAFCVKNDCLEIILKCVNTQTARNKVLQDEKILSVLLSLLNDPSDDIRIMCHQILKQMVTLPFSGGYGAKRLFHLEPNIVNIMVNRATVEPIYTVTGLLQCLQFLLRPEYVIPLNADDRIRTRRHEAISDDIHLKLVPFLKFNVLDSAQQAACQCISELFSHPNSHPPFHIVFSSIHALLERHGDRKPGKGATRGVLRVFLAFNTNTEAKKEFLKQFKVQTIADLALFYIHDMQIVLDALQVLCLVAEEPDARKQVKELYENVLSKQIKGSEDVERVMKRLERQVNWTP